VAEKSKKTDKAETPEAKPDAATPRFDPKPVVVGGESFVERLVPHIKKIAVGAIVLTIVLAAFFGFLAWKQGKREDATAELAKVIEISDTPVRAEGSGSADDKKTQTYASDEERTKAMLEALGPDDPSGPVYRASLLARLGRYDDALAAYREVQTDLGIEGVLAREGIGLALEAKATAPKTEPAVRQKGLEDALGEFKVMQPDEKGPRRAYALYHQGRILVMLGKRDEAKAAFEQAKTIGKAPELNAAIEERLINLGAS
jgi:tetratricopeptide (TPR) repeat protein